MSIRPVAAWLGAVLGMLSATAQAPSDSYLAGVDVGLERCQRGHWDIALKEFAAAAALDPDDPLAYVGQGICHLAERRLDQAAAYFRRAEQSDRAVAVASLGLGLCYLSVGDATVAEGLFQRSTALDGQLANARYYLAVTALCEGDLSAADTYLERARELGAPALAVDYLEALRLVGAGRLDEAASALRRLAPRTATATPGLPLALPLDVEQTQTGTRFVLPTAEPFAESVAPRVSLNGQEAGQAAHFGALTVESPLPGEIVAGKLPVRVRLLQAWNYRMVSIKVDGRLIGMTNREPYYLVWDTRNVDDGPHLIDVVASGQAGAGDVAVQVQVTVKNNGGASRNPHPADGYRERLRQLGDLCLHSLPSAAVERLMLWAYEQRDPELALEMCERILAGDPSRVDVLPRLLELCRAQRIALDPARIPEPRSGAIGGHRVALTFDDGPRPEITPPILGLLKQYRARATFLVTGRMSERHPELVRAIVADGHELASHTYNHYRLDSLTEPEILYELLKTKVVLDDLVGGSARFFRPPGGHYNASIRAVVARIGYFPVFWTVNGGEYAGLPPRQAALSLMRRIDDGAILLLHNGPDNTLPMLPHLLEFLAEKSYRLVTVSDILRAPTEALPLEMAGGAGLGPLSPAELSGYAGTE